MQILTWRDFVRRSSVSLSTLKRLEKSDPNFPQKIQISPNRVGFDEAAANQWMKLLAEQSPWLGGSS